MISFIYNVLFSVYFRQCYVCLPPHQSLTPGHCLIVPIHHVPCSVQADEDLWSEVQVRQQHYLIHLALGM